MTIPLPQALTIYLDAQRLRDPQRLDSCFAPDALVQDEGHTWRGLPQIKAWQQEAQAKYQYELAPLSLSQHGDTFKLLARVAGNFPGSPVNLVHTFTVTNGLVTTLQIRKPV